MRKKSGTSGFYGAEVSREAWIKEEAIAKGEVEKEFQGELQSCSGESHRVEEAGVVEDDCWKRNVCFEVGMYDWTGNVYESHKFSHLMR